MYRNNKAHETLYQLIYKGKRKMIYTGSDGNIYTRFKSNHKLTPLTQFQIRNSIYVRMGGRNKSVKLLVAQSFLRPQYRSGDFVECIDGDIWNCSVNNLRIVHRDDHFAELQNNRVQKKVKVCSKITGKVEIYNSIKDAGNDLGYDPSYLARSLRGELPMPVELRERYSISII